MSTMFEDKWVAGSGDASRRALPRAPTREELIGTPEIAGATGSGWASVSREQTNRDGRGVGGSRQRRRRNRLAVIGG
jgi:hypothetical protein